MTAQKKENLMVKFLKYLRCLVWINYLHILRQLKKIRAAWLQEKYIDMFLSHMTPADATAVNKKWLNACLS